MISSRQLVTSAETSERQHVDCSFGSHDSCLTSWRELCIAAGSLNVGDAQSGHRDRTCTDPLTRPIDDGQAERCTTYQSSAGGIAGLVCGCAICPSSRVCATFGHLRKLRKQDPDLRSAWATLSHLLKPIRGDTLRCKELFAEVAKHTTVIGAYTSANVARITGYGSTTMIGPHAAASTSTNSDAASHSLEIS